MGEWVNCWMANEGETPLLKNPRPSALLRVPPNMESRWNRFVF